MVVVLVDARFVCGCMTAVGYGKVGSAILSYRILEPLKQRQEMSWMIVLFPS